MAHRYQIEEAIHGELTGDAHAAWTGSARSDRQEYVGYVYERADTSPDDRPITSAEWDAIRAAAAGFDAYYG